jgi:hypothetical protein
MIAPAKYMDLDVCPLRVAALLLRALQQSGHLRVDECEARAVASAGEDARFTLLPALSLLFVLGLIDYSLESDVIGLRARPEASRE